MVRELQALQQGDEVMTTSGIYGRIVDLGDDDADLEIAPGTVDPVARGAIGQRLTEPDESPTARTRPRRPMNRAPPRDHADRDGRRSSSARSSSTLAVDNRPVLGLDLQGGISIVLFPVEGTDLAALDTAVDVIRNRVDGLGIAEPEVQRQGNTIVVDLPGVKDRAARPGARRRDRRAAVPTGACRATLPVGRRRSRPRPPTVDGDDDHRRPTATTVPGDPTATTAPAATTPTTVAGESLGAARDHRPSRSRRAARARHRDDDRTAPTTVAPAPTRRPPTTVPAATDHAGTGPDVRRPRRDARPENTRGGDGLAARPPGDDGEPDVCYLARARALTGRNIDSAPTATTTRTRADYVTDVKFKNDDFVEKIAQPFVGKQVAIELDGVVQSAPTINPGITGRDVQISG